MSTLKTLILIVFLAYSQANFFDDVPSNDKAGKDDEGKLDVKMGCGPGGAWPGYMCWSGHDFPSNSEAGKDDEGKLDVKMGCGPGGAWPGYMCWSGHDLPSNSKAANEVIDEISDNDASTDEDKPANKINTELQDQLAEGVMDEFVQRERKDDEGKLDVKMGCGPGGAWPWFMCLHSIG